MLDVSLFYMQGYCKVSSTDENKSSQSLAQVSHQNISGASYSSSQIFISSYFFNNLFAYADLFYSLNCITICSTFKLFI